MEEYNGVKFSYRLVEGKLPEISSYLTLDAKLRGFLNPKKNEGNMSIRVANGFLIKRTGAKMTELGKEDVSLVLEVDEDIVIAVGAVPSSETRMHYEIYGALPEVSIILHFHDENLLEKFEGASVGPFSYGSKELAKAAAKMARLHGIFMIKEHGFVLIAKNEEELLEMMKWKK
ncbi:class II aldolase/adducin family protein [Candidatus Micrarchaeota archaeon]|nr:class II aldolase/adducin family protein [Candidatus Micrarchaeota archaeon]